MNHSTTASGTQAATGSAAARVAAGSRERSDPRVVLADRVEQLYSQLPLGIAATVVIGLISALELREGRIIELVAFWGGLLLLVSALHAALYFAYRRSADKLAQGEQWLRWLGIGAFAAGVTWGLGASVFFPSHADERQVFLAFLLSGVMWGGIPVYAASWPIFAAYAAGIAIPFTYVLATFGNRLFAEIALLVPLFYGVSVAIAYRLNRVFHSGYRLRHAYGKLTEDYSVLNQRLEQQLGELEEARRQVEASGRKLTLFAERAPIAVVELDPAGRITHVNPASALLFRHTDAALLGPPPQQPPALHAPARPDQRPARHREDRVRQAHAGAGGVPPGRADARVAGAEQGLRRALQGALRAAGGRRRRRRPPGARRPQAPAAGDDQPALQ